MVLPPPFTAYHGVVDSEYDAVVEKCVEAGVVEYTTEVPWAQCGLFGVAKSEDLARCVLEARGANLCFETPEHTALPSSESLSKIAVPPGTQLRGALLDLDNYFHRLLLPVLYRKYFGLPATSDGRQVRWRTMGMGWSWSVFFAQMAHQHVLSRQLCGFMPALG